MKRKYLVITLFILYLIVLLDLTLFNKLFGRGIIEHSISLVPLKTIMGYIISLFKGNIYDFVVNILGNMIAFIPFALFLPILFKMNKLKYIIIMITIVIIIEILQYITSAGVCDIDDLILNVSGSYMAYLIINKRLA